MRLFRLEGFIERRGRVGIEVVLHQDNLFGVNEVLLGKLLEAFCVDEVFMGETVYHVAPSQRSLSSHPLLFAVAVSIQSVRRRGALPTPLSYLDQIHSSGSRRIQGAASDRAIHVVVVRLLLNR